MDTEARIEALEMHLAETRALLRNAEMVQAPVSPELDTRAGQLLSLLAPERTADGEFVRVGSAFDGGYVLPAAMSFDRVLAFGIGENCDFEEAMVARGATVTAFDHTIDAYPAVPTKTAWRRQGLAAEPAAGHLTLTAAIGEEAGSLLVKLDVEGAEWASLEATPPAAMARVSCLVVEFHGLDHLLVDAEWQRIVTVLERLENTFSLVHIHANNAGTTFRAAGRLVPSIVECTYVHRSLVGPCEPAPGPWPTALDAPNLPAHPDIELTSLWAPSLLSTGRRS